MRSRLVLTLVMVAATAHADPLPAPGEADALVDVATVIPDAVIDLRYATTNNFTGEVVYSSATCMLRRLVAERLANAAAILRAQHRRLLVWDCYRPTSAQKKLWALVPDPKYVADPRRGSRHSRGAAIDLAVVDESGLAVTLPTEFDDFSPAAHRKNALRGKHGVEAKQLAAAMRKAGFIGLSTEWWHFDAPAAANDPLSHRAARTNDPRR